ncbi:hypothetical protein [Propionivibrio sp.]|uniref:hypothetical protein n=1 Tax=Propionivibrio sp. TaxID=2212460 RepID=UPI0025FDC34F|nr:hypothetical protein [Propionivibrio sp.]MBK8744780.1 hypothetical protein [Propionivibrio sp.]
MNTENRSKASVQVKKGGGGFGAQDLMSTYAEVSPRQVEGPPLLMSGRGVRKNQNPMVHQMADWDELYIERMTHGAKENQMFKGILITRPIPDTKRNLSLLAGGHR